MKGSTTTHLRSPQTLLKRRNGLIFPAATETTGTVIHVPENSGAKMSRKSLSSSSPPGNAKGLLENAFFMKWRTEDLWGLFIFHPVPCLFAAALLFFMGVEYTLNMIPFDSQPFDLGFVATAHIHRLLASRPNLNNFLAGLNTVFVGMQTVYILWTWVVEGRPRATIAALYMFTCRGILGYATQLPLPEGFLGSGVDFPVGNASFFLFYSGHVAASVIASLDMKRVQRWEMAMTFDILNILQVVRLLSTRGHYTIDLAVGVGAGVLFDHLAGKYLAGKKKDVSTANGNDYNGVCTSVD